MKNSDVYQKVTDKILAIIDNNGSLPWTKPWTFTGEQLPCNYATKRPYTGINLIMTAFDQFESPYYLTAKEIKKRGGSWSGQGTLIVFWKVGTYKKKNKDGEEEIKKSFLLKHYYVWNEEQITGIEFKKPEKPLLNQFGEIKEVEDILKNMPNPPKVYHGQQGRACYAPMTDTVTMPLKGQFSTLEGYYKTFAHELIHSTGHKTRLNRDLKGFSMDRESYSKEELIAELGASFIMGLAGINVTEQNSAAYLKHWRNAISDDNTLIVTAAGKAQKAVDYILGKEVKTYDENEQDQSNEQAMAV